jgi:guanyl-specific ribonuclease Sa
MRRGFWIGALLLGSVAAWGWGERAKQAEPAAPAFAHEVVRPARDAGRDLRRSHDGLPAEAEQTLRRIVAGGPFDYRQDGAVFENRERRLPAQPRGYYHEYTVPTPGSGDRGARRIVAGGDPPVEFFYTDDHYRSFRRVDPGAAR